MITILKHIHRSYALLIILIFSTLFYPFYFLCSRNPKGYALLNYLRKSHSILCSFFIGVYFRFIFEEKLEKGKTYIYCANHTSNLDIMIMCVLAKGRFHFMGKEELVSNPVLKIFFSTIDVAVNRDSRISAFKAFKKVGENLEKGMSLIIFPEGKIDERYPPEMIPFKNGPFRLAIEKDIAIVPVSLANIWKRMWDDGSKYGSTPGICKIYVHKPVSTADLNPEDADLLKERIFEVINSKLDRK